MSRARREAWIKANAPAMDGLLVNPKLVGTDLNLVFYETATSLYILWQSMHCVTGVI